MDLQQENGSWSNALYSPKWTSTFYTLLLLMRFGAANNKNTEKACNLLLDKVVGIRHLLGLDDPRNDFRAPTGQFVQYADVQITVNGSTASVQSSSVSRAATSVLCAGARSAQCRIMSTE